MGCERETHTPDAEMSKTTPTFPISLPDRTLCQMKMTQAQKGENGKRLFVKSMMALIEKRNKSSPTFAAHSELLFSGR